MGGWIELDRKGEKPLLFERFVSTSERRLFLVYADGTIDVRPEGDAVRIFPIRAWRLDAVGHVHMLPRARDRSYETLRSQDGVPLDAQLSLALAPCSDDAALRRLIVDEEEQERQVAIALLPVIQKQFGSITWESALHEPHVVAAAVREAGASALADRQSPFRLHDVAVTNVIVRDADLPHYSLNEVKTRLQHKQALAEEANQLSLLQQKRDRLAEENQQRFDTFVIELDALDRRAQLAKTPEGRYALGPEQETKILIETIRAAGRARKEDMDLMIELAVTRLGSDLANGLIQRMMGVSLSDPQSLIRDAKDRLVAGTPPLSDEIDYDTAESSVPLGAPPAEGASDDGDDA